MNDVVTHSPMFFKTFEHAILKDLRQLAFVLYCISVSDVHEQEAIHMTGL